MFTEKIVNSFGPITLRACLAYTLTQLDKLKIEKIFMIDNERHLQWHGRDMNMIVKMD